MEPFALLWSGVIRKIGLRFFRTCGTLLQKRGLPAGRYFAGSPVLF